MKTTYFSIFVGTSSPKLVAEIADALMPYHEIEEVIISGHITEIDDDRAQTNHIATRHMSLTDLRNIDN